MSTCIYVYRPDIPADIVDRVSDSELDINWDMAPDEPHWVSGYVAVRFELSRYDLQGLFDKWPIFTRLDGAVCQNVIDDLQQAVSAAFTWIRANQTMLKRAWDTQTKPPYMGVNPERARRYLYQMSRVLAFMQLHPDWKISEE